MVELTIVIVLVGVIAMTASLLIGQATQSYQTEDNYSGALNQGRLALEKMGREIRMIRSPADITACTVGPPLSLTFTDTAGNVYAYTYSGTILRENGNTLADNLTSLTITYYDKNGVGTSFCTAATWTVTLNLTASQGAENISLKMTLHPRNF